MFIATTVHYPQAVASQPQTYNQPSTIRPFDLKPVYPQNNAHNNDLHPNSNAMLNETQFNEAPPKYDEFINNNPTINIPGENNQPILVLPASVGQSNPVVN